MLGLGRILSLSRPGSITLLASRLARPAWTWTNQPAALPINPSSLALQQQMAFKSTSTRKPGAPKSRSWKLKDKLTYVPLDIHGEFVVIIM
ncbi:MAG: hypothetical protein DHS80DRAFT_31492 [Piptocephalis tieghemiana]|nr:MAG: hypothetical protein DHS80DRAFT_31492 [Piptocephalis tieghemiana]